MIQHVMFTGVSRSYVIICVSGLGLIFVALSLQLYGGLFHSCTDTAADGRMGCVGHSNFYMPYGDTGDDLLLLLPRYACHVWASHIQMLQDDDVF